MKFLTIVCSLTFAVVGGSNKYCHEQIPRLNYTEGADFIIGGLFPVHLGAADLLSCTYNPQGAAWAEAMAFAVKEINANSKLLPNITLGYNLYDSYNRYDVAMRAVLEMILSENVTVSNKLNISNANKTGGNNARPGQQCRCTAAVPSSVIAVVGAASSAVSIKVSTLLSVDQIPEISYSSTSTSLSNKELYPSFLMTIPSDSFQALFIADVLHYFNWTYINVLASDDPYGRLGVDYLLPELQTKEICVGVMEIFSTQMVQSRTNEIIDKLKKEKLAKVTVLWCQLEQALPLFQRARIKGLSDMTWIATEAWASSAKLLELPPNIVAGLIGIIPARIQCRTYNDHLSNTKVEKLHTAEWLRDFFQTGSTCNNTFQNSSCSINANKTGSNLPANKISNVIDAVYAVAYGLQSLLKSQGRQGVRSTNVHVVPAELLQHIKTNTFVGQSGLNISFSDAGEPTSAAYSLINIQNIDKVGLKFNTIGSWNGKQRRIEFNEVGKIYWAGNANKVPSSKCADICPPGQFAFRQVNKHCCWKCVKCLEGEIKPSYGTDECEACPENSVSNTNRTKCLELQEVYIKLISPYGIFLVFSSCLGIVLSLFPIAVFVKLRSTPIVRSSNWDMSIFQLAVIVLIFLIPFLFIGKPKSAVCYLQPFIFGVLATISASITFTKTDRLLRIFKMKGRVAQGSLLLTNKIQLGIISTLVFIQLLASGLYCVMHPPAVKTTIQIKHLTKVIECGGIGTIVIGLIGYILVIALTCTIYAFRARKLPPIYSDVRYIGFAMFTESLIWVFYPAIYFSSSPSEIRSFIFCCAVLTTNYVMLLVMYGPKIWVMLVHPERNNPTIFRQETLGKLSVHPGAQRLDLRKKISSLRSSKNINNQRSLLTTNERSINEEDKSSISKLSISNCRRSSVQPLEQIETTLVPSTKIKHKEGSKLNLKRMARRKSTPFLRPSSVKPMRINSA